VGETPAETVREIEETRRRLDAELEELETYLPPARDQMKRTAAIAGGVMAAITVVGLLVRRRAKHESIRRLRDIDHRLERLETRLGR
jgi:hypothetical protein